MDIPIQWYALDELTFSDNNPNEGDIGLIYESIGAHGYRDTVHVYKGTVKGGEHRLKALARRQQDGYVLSERDTCAYAENGRWYVTGHPLDNMASPEHADAFMLMLNRSTREGRDDEHILSALLASLRSTFPDLYAATGYRAEDLNDLIVSPPDAFPSYDLDIDTAHTCPKCGYEWS